MLRVLIVDDEAPARDELKFLLSGTAGVSIAGEADSGPAAIGLAVQQRPNVIFLDIHMRGMSGIETAIALRAVLPDVLIVFATAYDEYAIKAFELGAVDYLLKPFEGERVNAAIERLQKYRTEEWREAGKRVDHALHTKLAVSKLPVEKNGKIFLVNYDDISYAHVLAGAVTVVTPAWDAVYPGTLTELQTRLQGTNLVRVHKSYIVNLDKVKEVVPWFKGTYWLKLESPAGVEIPVGKGQIKEVKQILGMK